MSEFKETVTSANIEQMDNLRENDLPTLKDANIPKIPKDVKVINSPLSGSSGVYDAAFKALGFSMDTSEGSKQAEASETSEGNDHSEHLEKGEDGKYYDKETGKAYDSIEDWEKAQETLAKRYEGTAQYYEDKAKKEWARYANAEENGESEAEKWEHYRKSQEYYAKAKECKEKAAKVRERLSHHSDTHNEDTPEQKQDNSNENSEVKPPIQNKIDGLAREEEVSEELKEKYPPEEGYEIVSESYLRDKDGKIVRDPESGEARRIDFVIIKDGKVVDSVEVTSKTADKTAQSAKESRIRDAGGNYVRDSNGNLVEIPSTVQTRIERRA